MTLLSEGTTVKFGKRSGKIVGYSTFTRSRPSKEFDTYYIVELDQESCGFLPRDNETYDTFISLMVVHPQNVFIDRDDGSSDYSIYGKC